MLAFQAFKDLKLPRYLSLALRRLSVQAFDSVCVYSVLGFVCVKGMLGLWSCEGLWKGQRSNLCSHLRSSPDLQPSVWLYGIENIQCVYKTAI